MATTTASPIPHNLVAEKSVLGAVLLDEQHLHALLVDEQLRPEHFYVREHSAVFQAMLELYEADKKIDHRPSPSSCARTTGSTSSAAPMWSRSWSLGCRRRGTRATTAGSCASRRRCAPCWRRRGRSRPTSWAA